MARQMVVNEEYEIKQGKTVTILTDQTITIQAKFIDPDVPEVWAILINASTEGDHSINLLKDCVFRATALTGGTGTVFDYSPKNS